MPILSNFPGGSGSGGGGLALTGVSGITTLTAHEKVYVKWTDPDDFVVAGSTLAAWGGTLLVRKAGSAPTSRRDGTVVLDSKTKNAYQNTYFCDSGLTNGVQYFYKFFPYTTANSYTDVDEDLFNATPQGVAPGNVSGITTEASGNGKLTVKWTDPAATIVQDGITRSTWASTKVVYKTGGYPTSPEDGTLAVNSTTRNGYATNGFQITGLTNGTTYYIAFFPVSTDGAVNTNAANRTTGVPDRLEIITAPTQKNVPNYDGTSKTPEWNGYDTTKMMLTGGDTSGTNAKTNYSAQFTPKDDYCWAASLVVSGMASNTAPKPVAWAINKGTGTMTGVPTAMTLNKDTLNSTFTIAGNFDGSYTVQSSDTGVATVALASGKTYRVSSVNNTTGTASITVTPSGGSNWTVPAAQTIAVTAQFLPAKKALNDTTWSEISQVSEADQGANYWAVGDRKAVTVNGTIGTQAINSTFYVFILGFNHNSAVEGKGIQFQGFKSALTGGADICLVDDKYNSNGGNNGAKKFQMNHWGTVAFEPYNTNYGGWAACDMRYDILGSTNQQPTPYGSTKTTVATGQNPTATCATSPVANTLMAALPSDLRAVMKPITKWTDNYGNSSNTADHVTPTIDYLPLLAEWEIFGARTHANENEKNHQAQYAYYSAGNSKVKNRHDNTGTAAVWLGRSPNYSTAYYFCGVFTNGNANSISSRDSRGLAPAFMV